MRSTLSRLANENGHRVRVMGVLSALEHIFNDTARNAKAQARNRVARAIRASHGPRVGPHSQEKVRVKKTKTNQRNQKCEPRRQRFTQGQNIENWSLRYGKLDQRQVQKLRNRDMSAPFTLPGTIIGMVTKGTMAGVSMNGMMTGVPLSGTKVGINRMTLPQAHFRLEVWMSVPPAVRSGLNGQK